MQEKIYYKTKSLLKPIISKLNPLLYRAGLVTVCPGSDISINTHTGRAPGTGKWLGCCAGGVAEKEEINTKDAKADDHLLPRYENGNTQG